MRACIKILFVLSLLYTGFVQLWARENFGLVQNINLIFHEAGHVVFWFFGQFLYVLGGTILELLVPLLVAGYFFSKRQYISSCFGLWWCTTACISVGRYAADAQERLLPLITNDPHSHDWRWLLTETGLLRYDNSIGEAFFILGTLALASIVGVAFLDKDVQRLLHRHTLR